MKPTLCQNFAETQWGRFCEEEGQGGYIKKFTP